MLSLNVKGKQPIPSFCSVKYGGGCFTRTTNRVHANTQSRGGEVQQVTKTRGHLASIQPNPPSAACADTSAGRSYVATNQADLLLLSWGYVLLPGGLMEALQCMAKTSFSP